MKLKLRRRYIAVASLILAGAVFTVCGQLIMAEAFERVADRRKALLDAVLIKDKIKDLRSDVLLIETRVRGFVITEKETFAKDLDLEFDKAFLDLKDIRQSAKRNSQFTMVVDSIDHFIELKIQFQRHILELYRRNGKIQAEQLIGAGAGKALRENILAATNALVEFADKEVKTLQAEIEKQSRISSFINIVLPYLSLAVYSFLGFLILRNFDKREKILEGANKSAEQERSDSLLKDQFISNISHEVRTPLNSVIGYAGLLQRTELNETQTKFVKAIQTSGENLLYIVNELLDFGKIEEGLLIFNRETFNFTDVINQVTLMFHEGFRKKNIELIVDIDPELTKVQGDVTKVRQVLVNLINNALKFTETGKVEVSARIISTTSNQCNVQIIVRDTGIGIAKEHLPRIFERFYQVHGAIDRKYGGAGLGLSIIHQLVELMGGSISVSSEPLQGTQFTVAIPFDLPSLVEPQAYKFTIKGLQHGKKRILVVDDNILNRDLTMHVLTSWNYEVKTAESGKRALHKLATEKFDLILMDIQMPGMDGYTLTRQIRSETSTQIPIIALTAHSNSSEREKCIEAGMNDYISKPFNELELFELIAKLLASDTQNSGIIKLDYLKSLSKGNKEFEQRILKRCVDEIGGQVVSLEEAFFKADLKLIHKLIHEIKNNVAVVGLDKRLENEFLAMTRLQSETEIPEVMESFEIINSTLKKCIEQINQLLL